MRLFLRAARVPARFHAVNVVGGAMLMGAVTSLSQRVVCGRTGSAGEVGKLPSDKDKMAAAATAAAAKATAAAPAAKKQQQQPAVRIEQSTPPAEEEAAEASAPAQPEQPSIALSPLAQTIQVDASGAHIKPEDQ